MARYYEPTAEIKAAYKEWTASRPPKVRDIAERLNPWTLYRLKETGQRVILKGISEDGTISVIVSGLFNFVLNERQVYGIDPDDLEECDLPTEDELTGCVLTQEQVGENIDELRVLVRPDLWVMGPDGKAVRKQ